MTEQVFRVLELCAGAGGQALGLEQAGFEHAGAIELDGDACLTLLRNRPHWNVLEADLNVFDAHRFRGVDLVAAGVPCPPFSMAGKQLGANDERDLFPAALRVVAETRPRAVLFENVRGLSTSRFETYRAELFAALEGLGYVPQARVLNASDFGVPQLRPRFLVVALRPEDVHSFIWPQPLGCPPTVGEALSDLMSEGGWAGANAWRSRANQIAPTLVGGSKKHGGPDLGPTRAKEKWHALGVDGHGLAAAAPTAAADPDFLPRLTVRMAARIQGFPDDWLFYGAKTSAYRQIGNAFPPPVAHAVGLALRQALFHAPAAEVEAQPMLLEPTSLR